MAYDYWKECVAEAAEDCKAVLTDEQITCIASWVEGAHDNYRQATGLDVADRNWRAAEDDRLRKDGANKVLHYVEDRVATIDNGPARAFDVMSPNQRFAMHELFQARIFLRKSGLPVD
jgi:hypothetical protein